MDTGNLGGPGFRRRLAEDVAELALDDVRSYAVELRQAWARVSDRLSRQAVLVILLLGAYLLIRANLVSSVSIGGVSIRGSSSLAPLFLLALSYSVFEIHLLTIRWSEMEIAHGIVMAQRITSDGNGELSALLAPPLPALWNPAHLISARNARHWSRLRAIAQWVLGIVTSFGSTIFVIIEAARSIFGASSGAPTVIFSVTAGALAVYSAYTVVSWWFAERAL